MRHKRTPEVDSYIERVRTVPKQNAHFTFGEPQKPQFIAEETAEQETLEEELQDLEELSEEQLEEMAAELGQQAPSSTASTPSAKVPLERKNASNKPGDLEFYAEGRIMIIDLIMKYVLAIINGDSPSKYKLDSVEQEVLTEAQARVMEEEGEEYSPKRMRNEALAIIYVPKALTGIWNRLQQVYEWFTKKKDERKAAQLQRQQKRQAEELEQTELEELRKKANHLEQQLEQERAAKQPTQQTKTKAVPKKQTAKPAKAPTTNELQALHKSGLCLMPDCGKSRGKNKSFCSGACKSRYVGATARKKDPFPKLKEVKL